MNVNSIVIGGFVGRDPETKEAGGMTFSKFSLANSYMKKGEKLTQWVNVVAFGKTAEFVQKYVVKGKAFIVVGSLQIENYQKKDGTSGVSVNVIANQVNFGSSAADGQAAQAASEIKAWESPVAKAQPEAFDDIPF